MDQGDPSTWTYEYKRSLYLDLHQHIGLFKLIGQNDTAAKAQELLQKFSKALGFSETDVSEIIAFGESKDEMLLSALISRGLQVRQ